MTGVTDEIRDVLDNYHNSNDVHRLLISADAMQQLFIAERIWRGINKIDATEERIRGYME